MDDQTAAIWKVRCTDGRREVRHNSDEGPVFGYDDLYLSDKCNENSRSSANIGRFYDRINGISYLDQGNQYSRVSEIEVFLLE